VTSCIATWTPACWDLRLCGRVLDGPSVCSHSSIVTCGGCLTRSFGVCGFAKLVGMVGIRHSRPPLSPVRLSHDRETLELHTAHAQLRPFDCHSEQAEQFILVVAEGGSHEGKVIHKKIHKPVCNLTCTHRWSWRVHHSSFDIPLYLQWTLCPLTERAI